MWVRKFIYDLQNFIPFSLSLQQQQKLLALYDNMWLLNNIYPDEFLCLGMVNDLGADLLLLSELPPNPDKKHYEKIRVREVENDS